MAIYMTTQQSITALMFTRSFSPLYARVSRNLAREIASYMGAYKLLATCIDGTITVFDLEKGTSRSNKLDLVMKWEVVYCHVNWRTILYLSTERCSTIDLLTFQVTDWPCMHVPRANPGLICVEGVCYVFGGKRSDLLTSSEKFVFTQNQWQPIPALPTPKYAFIPCHYQADLYLAEANDSLHSFDVFSIDREEYRSIPYKIQCNLNGCVSFIVNADLFLLTMSGQCLKWNLTELDSDPALFTVKLSDQNSAYSSCSPMLVADKVYWVNYLSGTIVRFHPASLQIEEGVSSLSP